MASAYPQATIDTAKLLFIQKHSVKEIRTMLGINTERVIRQWITKFGWELLLQHETVEESIARRICLLAERDKKSDFDLKEMDKLVNHLDKLAGIDVKKAKALNIKNNPDSETGSNGRQKRRDNKSKIKNDISSITAERLKEIREELFFGYQKTWHDNKHQRIRFILKSRQIGATYYFAWEAFEDAILTGDNQIFLSASRNQAEIFKAYIIGFAHQYFDIELKGDVITLSNGAELRFLSTNARTAQGYHGHLYVDEVFWMQSFEKVNEVASGIASQKKWRTTYFSTPSIKTHSAYPLWAGEWFNKARKRKKKIDIDISHKSLASGQLGADGIWRHIVTVVDAEKQGCDLFDIKQLRNERAEAVFRNLFMCEFRQEGDNVFGLDVLLDCGIDAVQKWTDFNKDSARPFGNRPVWVGYDPARRGDQSILAIVAPPLKPSGKHRVLEWIKLSGSYPHQAERIEEIFKRYNVQFLGVDVTGQGLGVYEMVLKFFPAATPIHYNPNVKTMLVLKGMDVVEGRRIEWDAGDSHIPQSFLQIRQVITKNSDQITYAADRTAETGHADVAWSILHALHHEPLDSTAKHSNLSMTN